MCRQNRHAECKIYELAAFNSSRFYDYIVRTRIKLQLYVRKAQSAPVVNYFHNEGSKKRAVGNHLAGMLIFQTSSF